MASTICAGQINVSRGVINSWPSYPYHSKISPKYARSFQYCRRSYSHCINGLHNRYNSIARDCMRLSRDSNWLIKQMQQCRSITSKPSILYNKKSDNDNKDESKIIAVDLGGITKPIKTAVMFFLLSRMLDEDLTKQDFLAGAKQAFNVINKSIRTKNFDNLNGLISPEALESARRGRMLLDGLGWDLDAITGERVSSISTSSPNDVTLVYDSEAMGGRKFVYVSVRFTFIDISKLQQQVQSNWKIFTVNTGQSIRDSVKMIIFMLRFKREFTKGAKADWTVSEFNCVHPSVDD